MHKKPGLSMIFPHIFMHIFKTSVNMRCTKVIGCDTCCLQSIEAAIGGNAYQHNKVNQWTSNVVEQCLNQLTKLAKPFKYIGELMAEQCCLFMVVQPFQPPPSTPLIILNSKVHWHISAAKSNLYFK